MPDDQDPNKPSDTQPQTAPATQSTPVITPDIEALIAERVKKATDAVWAESRRTYESKSKASGTQQRPESAPAPQIQAPDFSAEIARHTAFTRAVGKLDITDEAFDILQGDFSREKPEDPTSWVARRASAFGWKPFGQHQTTTPVAEKPSTPVQQPPVMQAGSPPSRQAPDDMPILSMSDTDRIALEKRIGPFRYRERLYSELRQHNVRITRK